MILADKIIEERKKNGWSQEELAEMLSVSRQSVSKWEGAQSVPDLGKIVKMAEIFGVTTDYLIKDEIESREISGFDESYTSKPSLIKVSMEEACDFLETEEKTAPLVALGASLFILSPAFLIFLLGISAGNFMHVTEATAGALGMFLLFIFVAVGVLIMIRTGAERKKFEYIESKAIDTAYGVTGMVKKRKAENENRNTVKISTGIVICVLSAVPLIVGSFLSSDDVIMLPLTSFLLAMVAIGVNLIVRATIVSSSYSKLLQEGDYTVKRKANSPLIGRISGIYWLLATAAYLGWSFVSDDWHRTWIIWPVAGVLFAAVIIIIKIIIKDED